jgi:hypothetical protein
MNSPNENTADEEIRKKRQRMRSVAIAVGLGVLSLLFFFVTIVRFGSHLPIKP